MRDKAQGRPALPTPSRVDTVSNNSGGTPGNNNRKRNPPRGQQREEEPAPRSTTGRGTHPEVNNGEKYTPRDAQQ